MTGSAGHTPFDPASFACLAVESATGVGSIAACVGDRTALREYAGHPMQSRDIYAGISEVLRSQKAHILQERLFSTEPAMETLCHAR